MNGVLERGSYDSGRTEIRRLILAALVLAFMSAVWYTLRPYVIFSAGRSSVGFPVRQLLLASALRQKMPGFPPDDRLINPPYIRGGRSNLRSFCVPPPGWVEWRWIRESVTRDGARADKWQVGIQVGIVDHLLRLQGTFSNEEFLEAPPGDMDADGRWEIVRDYQAIPAEQLTKRDVRGWVVVRLGRTENEIVGAALSDPNLWGSRRAQIKPMWRDGTTAGTKELVFVTIVTIRLPGGGIGFKPPETVAVLGWDHPGGILRPRLLQQDSGIIAWEPPGGNPVKIAPDADLEPILGKLLPVPQGFGTVRATRPATSPS